MPYIATDKRETEYQVGISNSTQNKCFCGEIRKISILLKKVPYQELWS